MYCIKCGAHLSDGQTTCPICNTRVYHPDFIIEEKSTYPKGAFVSEEFNPKGLLFFLTILCLIPLLLPIILELTWMGRVSWSGYVAGGTILFYLGFILPFWFKHPSPTIFIPILLFAITGYLLYICLQSGGTWFWAFAFPLMMSLTAIISAETALLQYLKRGKLYIVGGGLISLGVWSVLLEVLINLSFDTAAAFRWSSAPLTIFSLLGIALIVIGIVKPFKESLRRIFFIGKID